MPAKAFVIAMAADIARSDYAKPTLVRSRDREWLIACRWGPDGEYLSIATAGPVQDPIGLFAPDVISPIHSMVGVLVSESRSEGSCTFLLTRQLPLQLELAGTFFPADGYVLLQERDDFSLVCEARYSHSCGWLDGREVRKDIPDSDGMAHRSRQAQLDWRILPRARDDAARGDPRQRVGAPHPDGDASASPGGLRHPLTGNSHRLARDMDIQPGRHPHQMRSLSTRRS